MSLRAKRSDLIDYNSLKYRVTATIKPVAGKRKNGFDKFPDIRFMASDVPLYSRNIGKKTAVKTN
ncbi:hypothetical protein ES703_22793 [subsurface metagenome]